MKIYISIPISGHDLATQQRKALEVADKLRELGHETVSPLPPPIPPEGLTKKEEYAFYMGEDIKKLLTCDAIFLCEGWADSKGCRFEAQAALVYEIEQYGRIDDIPNNK